MGPTGSGKTSGIYFFHFASCSLSPPLQNVWFLIFCLLISCFVLLALQTRFVCLFIFLHVTHRDLYKMVAPGCQGLPTPIRAANWPAPGASDSEVLGERICWVSLRKMSVPGPVIWEQGQVGPSHTIAISLPAVYVIDKKTIIVLYYVSSF